MKVVLLGRYNNSEYLNGPEKFAKRLFSYLRNYYADTYFIEYYFKDYEDSRYKTRLIGKKILSDNNFRLGILKILHFLIKYKPDIIHITALHRFMIPVLLFRFLYRGKIVFTCHSIIKIEISGSSNAKLYSQYKDYSMEYLALRFSDYIVFVSSMLENFSRKYYQISRKKIVVIPNGSDEIFYIKRNLPDITNDIRLVFYDGFSEHIDRGLKTILEVLRNSKIDFKITIYIIGNRYYGDYHLDKIELKYTGAMNTEELAEFLYDKHIFIKSITFDSFPVMAVECMAAGKIIIVSDNVGVVEYIKNGTNGFIYSKNKPEDIVDILEKIVKKQVALEQISENASKSVKNLGWDSITKRYLELYQRISQ